MVSVGRVAPEKNLPLTLQAFAEIRRLRPNARLVIVGDGPLRSQLAQRHPEHIYAGMRTGEDLAAHYASGDLFLFPSLTETYGNVTLEAMASGLGIVAYACAAAAEVITPGIEGSTARPGDEAGFIAAAVILAQDEALRQRMALCARDRAQDLDWDRVHDRFSAELLEVAQTPLAPRRAALFKAPRHQEA